MTYDINVFAEVAQLMREDGEQMLADLEADLATKEDALVKLAARVERLRLIAEADDGAHHEPDHLYGIERDYMMDMRKEVQADRREIRALRESLGLA
jgi:hypothetical protein